MYWREDIRIFRYSSPPHPSLSPQCLSLSPPSPLSAPPLSPLPSSQEGRDALIAQFGSFDARHAVCFLQQDTDRLQNTIEGGFGSLAAFS